MRPWTRRNLIARGGAALALGLDPTAVWASRLAPTPAQSEGPFYPDYFPPDTDNDLVRLVGRARDAEGEILALEGWVVDPAGRPASETLVEIWQADANGRYLASGDRWGFRPRDENFQGYGTAWTDAEGRYRFRTIRPVPYTGRTPHIHVKVHHPEGRVLTTQMYVADEPLNAGDVLYRRLGADERRRVTVPLARLGGSADAAWGARFEIVLPWVIAER
jgi:protocatechuate 3,4-dioxygenase beta subunit